MYETFGEELEQAEKHFEEFGNNYIWTIVDGSNSKMYLIPGWHYINRIGYALTTIPWKEGEKDYLY
jgi:hypothetical protein